MSDGEKSVISKNKMLEVTSPYKDDIRQYINYSDLYGSYGSSDEGTATELLDQALKDLDELKKDCLNIRKTMKNMIS